MLKDIIEAHQTKDFFYKLSPDLAVGAVATEQEKLVAFNSW